MVCHQYETLYSQTSWNLSLLIKNSPTLILAKFLNILSHARILRYYHQLSPSLTDRGIFVTGGTTDHGIDGATILVNREPIQCIDDVPKGEISVEFVFIQSKSSPRFQARYISEFIRGVRQFFLDEPPIPFAGTLANLASLQAEIYARHGSYMRELPMCHLYYVTTGDWRDQREPQVAMEEGKDDLLSMENGRVFSKVAIQALGRDELVSINRELHLGVTKKVTLKAVAEFPPEPNMPDGLVGLIPAAEFITLISTHDGQLNRDLFHTNLRDFQGSTPVNKEIDNTLGDPDRREWFSAI